MYCACIESSCTFTQYDIENEITTDHEFWYFKTRVTRLWIIWTCYTYFNAGDSAYLGIEDCVRVVPFSST